MKLFARAAAYAPLTPAERGVLRAVQGVIGSALLAGVQAVTPLLNSGMDLSAIPWSSVGHTFVAAVMLSVGLALHKYATAQGDPAPNEPPSPSSAAPAAAAPAAPTVPPIVAPIPAAPAAGPVAADGSSA